MSLCSSRLSSDACCTATRKTPRRFASTEETMTSPSPRSHLRIKDDSNELFDSIYSAQTSNYFFIGGEWEAHRKMQIELAGWVMATNNLKGILECSTPCELVLNAKRDTILARSSLTSHISRKSCCSTRNNSHVVFVTTVLSRGKSCRTDSPKVAPTPRLHSVMGLCGRDEKES